MDAGSVGRNNPVLLNRTKHILGTDKPAVKSKPRSSTLPIPTTVSSDISVDRKMKQEERNECNGDGRSQLEMGTGEHEVPPSVTPTETWTNDLTATDPSSEQLRGNQVPHPSE